MSAPPWQDGAVKSQPTATEARLAHVAPCAPAPVRLARWSSSRYWQPRFSGREIRQARAVARQRAAPHGPVQRARLACLLGRHPTLPSPEVGRRLGRSAGWVYQSRRRWVVDRFRLDDRPRPRRPWVYPAVARAL